MLQHDTARHTLHEMLRASAAEFGPELAGLAYARGLSVTKADGSTTPIPIAATPVVLDAQKLQERQRLAAHLSSAGLKMSRAALKSTTLRTMLLGALSPLEAELALQSFAQLDTLATTRVDFFDADRFSALEINATIPAMQGYSDIAAHTFLDVMGGFAGMPTRTIEGWKARNGSNARALHDALVSGYRRVRVRGTPRRIAILCRRNDAQLSELRFLRDRFRALGTDAEVIHPDQIAEDNDAVRVDDKRYDLVYRHIFVRRLEEPDLRGALAVKKLLAEENGRRAVVMNPPASQVEMKSVFALLSQSLEDEALARAANLTSDELAAIHDAVRWTRMFSSSEADLVAKVSANPEGYVLKRAWDYGGRAVFVGRAHQEPSFRQRVQSIWSDAPADWAALCARAANDARGGGFVVQEVVDARPEPHVLCHLQHQEPAQLYVDFSAYASVGLNSEPQWGGVCRGSSSSIVNIMGGGGLVPLITAEVANELAIHLMRAISARADATGVADRRTSVAPPPSSQDLER